MDKSEMQDMIDGLRNEFTKSSSDLTKEISEALKSIIDAFESRGKYVARRFDDIDKRLTVIENKLKSVDVNISELTNWSKTTDKIYHVTQTHAYEIPKMEHRITSLEEKHNMDSSES